VATVPLILHLSIDENGELDWMDYFLIVAFFVCCVYIFMVLFDKIRGKLGWMNYR
jgi:hypothetical protein